jgi:phenylalanyl-tRNA synthetase alpha chain
MSIRSIRDLTDPAAGPHAMQLIVQLIIKALTAGWDVPVVLHRGDPVVSVHDHYDLLRYPPDAVTRDRRYSRYVDDDHMLRAHTTAHIPALLRDLPHSPDGDVLLAVPGICYRRDVIDRHHVGEPHQLDLWRIRLASPALDEADLTGMISRVARAVLPGKAVTTPPSPHPYTVGGRELYVDGVEIGECGLAHPEVLAAAGLPASASGLAMGLGLDRLTMLVKGIDDIRLLRSTDPRVAAQMRDLDPYRPVSAMPPVRRDLSLAVAADTDPELLGDRVREALGAEAESLEDLTVLSETAYADLPPTARDRLGIRAGQKNILLRLVIRSHERTLTAAEANTIRDHVYTALHAGSTHERATSGR